MTSSSFVDLSLRRLLFSVSIISVVILRLSVAVDVTTDVTSGSSEELTTLGVATTSLTPPTDVSDCGVTVGCFSDSLGNVVKYLATTDGLEVYFEIICRRTGSGWCGIGFSDNPYMASTSVIDCIFNSNGQITVQHSYNYPGYYNVIVDNATAGISNVSTNYLDGVITCQFYRSVFVNESDLIYNLDKAYYLILGEGPVNAAVIDQKQKHEIRPTASASTIDVRVPPAITSTNMTTLTVSTTLTTTPPNTGDCGVTVGCFGDSLGNVVKYLATTDGLEVYFEIICRRTGSGWCGIGFSDDPYMASTSVIDCILNSNGQITVQHSYNYPYPTYNVIVDNAEAGISNVSTNYSDGVISCQFYRSVFVNESDLIYNLDKAYYLILGTGPVNASVIDQKLKHEIRPTSSTSKIDVRVPPTNTSTTAATTTTVMPPDSGDCGITVGCFSDNYGNIAKYSATSDGLDVQFEIICQRGSVGWCALGFSNDGNMGPSSVLDCIRNSTGQIIVQNSYNEPRTNIEIDNPTKYIQVLSTSYVEGSWTCKFLRRIEVDASDSDQIFNLNTAYYLLLGKGLLDASGKKVQHDTTPAVSSSKIDVRENLNAEQTGGCSICLLRAHGCLMITAWILIVGTSIMLARYFKTAWPGDKICNTAVWFAAHRFLMVLALFCTAAGFIIIFVFNDGRYAEFPSDAPEYFWLHAPLGIIVMTLVIVNPVMALFRCDPGAIKRPIFNWMHWLVGTTCHILAVIAVFIGVKIGEKSAIDERISHPAIFWMLIGYVSFHCLAEISLTIHKLTADIRDATQKKYAKENEEDAEKTDKSVSWDLKFRYRVLATYILVVTGLSCAMVIMIGSGITS